MEINLHKSFLRSHNYWIKVTCNIVILFTNPHENDVYDYLLILYDTSLESIKIGDNYGLIIKSSSYRHNKYFKISFSSENKRDKILNDIQLIINNSQKIKRDKQLGNINKIDNSIRVCSYNVNFGCCIFGYEDETEYSISDSLKKTEADIVLLQETTPHWEKYFNKIGLNITYPHKSYYTYDKPNDIQRPNAGGLAVLSKYPIIDTSIIESPCNWFPAQLILIEIPNFGELQFLNLHLHPPLTPSALPLPHAYITSKWDREFEVQYFAGFLNQNIPSIVCGDFNENSSAYSARFWTKHQKMNSALDKYPSGVTWWWKLPLGIKVTANFDHMFYKKLICTNANVIQEGKSDHYPIYGDFILHPN